MSRDWLHFALDDQIIWDVAVNRIPHILKITQALLNRLDQDRGK